MFPRRFCGTADVFLGGSVEVWQHAFWHGLDLARPAGEIRAVPRSDGVIYRICNFCAFVFKFFSSFLCAGLACVGSARNAHGCFLCGRILRTSLSLSHQRPSHHVYTCGRTTVTRQGCPWTLCCARVFLRTELFSFTSWFVVSLPRAPEAMLATSWQRNGQR